MNLYVQSLDTKSLFDLRFDPKLEDNYLKIISNIYHLNLTRTVSRYGQIASVDELIKRVEAGDKSADRIIKRQFNDIYKSLLDETREEVANFFNLSKHPIYEIPLKILLRIYPLYLSKDSTVRKEYSKLSEIVNNLIEKLERKAYVAEFQETTNSNYANTPIDKVFDFQAALNSASDDVEISNNVSASKEEEIKNLMNKFNAKFNENKTEAD